MLFNSLEFAIFFPLVIAAYFLLPRQYRLGVLLLGSCLFYMAFAPLLIALPLLTILVDYSAARVVECSKGKIRKLSLAVGIVIPCLLLFIFKYLNFFLASTTTAARWAGWDVGSSLTLNILLPMGISFYTFQSLSYLIEVYRGKQKAETNLPLFTTYIMFFPQLVAGPIERPQNLLHQFREEHPFNYAGTVTGLQRIALGFFKKLVVADRLAIYVNDVYIAPRQHNGLQLSLATFFFAYQIYCDFSGYTDIAIGAARILGFRLMENFRAPYHSGSISEFWQRWHISLSTWFRDYIYVPLGGNRCSPLRHSINLLITFAISGFWHGANWTFVLWGALNGLLLIIENFKQSIFPSPSRLRWPKSLVVLHRGVSIGFTFLLICFGWVLFRARNMADAGYILTHFYRDWDFAKISTMHFLLRQLPIAVGAIAATEVLDITRQTVGVGTLLRKTPMVLRWATYILFILAVILFGIFRETQFIYFQF